MCMHLYTYVYSACYREIVGSSPTRGGLLSRKDWMFQENLQQLKVGAVSRAWWAFRMLILRNKYVYICIYAFQLPQITRDFVICLNQFLMCFYHNDKNNVYVHMYIIGVCAVNGDHQQCWLSLVVNSGTTDLASSSGTNRIVKQENFI